MTRIKGVLKPLDTIQDRIRYLRRVNEISLKSLSKKFFFSDAQITFMESGKRTIGHNDIKLYCDYFGVSADWLINGDPDAEA